MVLQVYSPNAYRTGPVPLMLKHSFNNTRDLGFREHRRDPKQAR